MKLGHFQEGRNSKIKNIDNKAERVPTNNSKYSMNINLDSFSHLKLMI